MKRTDFHFELPENVIAQEPASRRDTSRLMVLCRGSAEIQHRQFHDLVSLLRPGDVLVLNSTKVFPARLRGKKSSGGKVELLLIQAEGQRWKALVRGTTKAVALEFPEGLKATMEERLTHGEWLVHFSTNHIRDYLDRHGEMPLPPYIKRAAPRASDLSRYQTVYAQQEGAIAAPTAGFHFSESLLQALKDQGVQIERVLLHVGWGTFRPVRTDLVTQHEMLPESYSVTETTARALNAARCDKRRIIAVGTTVTRTLESTCDQAGQFQAGTGQTNLFIYPGYSFRAIDALVTNFHLPDSTPLLLACAFFADRDGGSADRGIGVTPNLRYSDPPSQPFSLRDAYQAAIREGYRFYSYGDAMFIQ